MKKIKSNNLFLVLAFGYLLVFQLACLQKEEGCRDVNATNFAANAELDCENCCNYPTISFEIDHAAGDTSLRYGDTISFEDKRVKFLETSFYINGISLTSGDQTLSVTDQLTLTDRAGNQHQITDDIAIISRDISSFTYEIGSFRGQGSYDDLNFQVGLSPLQATTAPSTVPDDHPLFSDNGRFTEPDSTYIFTRLRLVNLDLDDTLTYNINTPVNITLPYSVTINRGFDVDIPIKVDYLTWIQGINFADNTETTREIIVGNLQKAFSIRE